MAQLLDKKQVCEKIGVGRSKFDEMRRQGIFPSEKYLPTSSKKLWLESAVDDWIATSLKSEPPTVAACSASAQ